MYIVSTCGSSSMVKLVVKVVFSALYPMSFGKYYLVVSTEKFKVVRKEKTVLFVPNVNMKKLI